MTFIHIGLLSLSINLFLAQASYVPPAGKRLSPRRMGGQNLQLGEVKGCPGYICGVLLGKVPGSLLAGADPCASQDLADEMITIAKTSPELKGEAKDQLIAVAKVVAGAERNSHPDYKNNSEPRNFLYCLKAPKNPEIANIIPKQDPKNPPDKFVDPKNQQTILLDADPRTRPRKPIGENGAQESIAENAAEITASNANRNSGNKDKNGNNSTGSGTGDKNVNNSTGSGSGDKNVLNTVTLTTNDNNPNNIVSLASNDKNLNNSTINGNLGTGENGGGNKNTNSPNGGTSENGANKNGNNTNGATGENGGGNKSGNSTTSGNGGGENGGSAGGGTKGFQGIFIDPKTLGNCNNPKIVFQSGFNGRQAKDLTFHPEDQKNYPQGEALNLAIVTRAMCDKMLNCGFKNEDLTIKNCRELGSKIGSSQKDGTGADNWNAAFGIVTSFKDVKFPA